MTLTPEKFQERIANWKEPTPIQFIFEELCAIQAKDFPPGARIKVGRIVGLTETSPGKLRSKFEFEGIWRVENGRFVVDLVVWASDSPWNSSITPSAYCDLCRASIENREKMYRDVRRGSCLVAPRPGIAFACEYALLPPQRDLIPAYVHAVNTDAALLGHAHAAANRLDAHLRAEGFRITNWEGPVKRVRLPPRPPPQQTKTQVELAREIFEAAEAFRDAAYVLQGRVGELSGPDELKWLMFSPAIVNGALGVELSLKCLLQLEGVAIRPADLRKRGHDLEFLFSKTSKLSQEKIRRFYTEAVRRDPKTWYFRMRGMPTETDFDSALSGGYDAFVKHRYRYERDNAWYPYGLGNVQRAVRNLVLEMHPEWTCLVAEEPVVFNPHAEFRKRGPNLPIIPEPRVPFPGKPKIPEVNSEGKMS